MTDTHADADLGLDLEARLVALERRAPARSDSPSLAPVRRRGRFAAPLVLAPMMVLALVATATAGAVVVRTMVETHEGVENPGQPLAGANLECMSPPAAAGYLVAHGFHDVVWEVQTGDLSDGAGGKGATSAVSRASAPEHGFVIPASIASDGKLHIVVDQRVGASGVGACFGRPMP